MFGGPTGSYTMFCYRVTKTPINDLCKFPNKGFLFVEIIDHELKIYEFLLYVKVNVNIPSMVVLNICK